MILYSDTEENVRIIRFWRELGAAVEYSSQANPIRWSLDDYHLETINTEKPFYYRIRPNDPP